MKQIGLSQMTVDQLVEQFAALAVEQDQAELIDDNAKFTRLYWQMDAVEKEMKTRGSDQRRSLLRLYGHPNAQVRLAAAKATLAVAPLEARQTLEAIANSHRFPQAGDAGMTITHLDRGFFKPT